MRPEAGRLVLGTVWVSASRVIEGAVVLAFSISVARELGEDYGYIGAAMGVFGILNIVTRLGIGQANTRFVARLRARGENSAARTVIGRTLLLEGVVALVVAVALALSHGLLAEEVFGKPDLAMPLLIVSPMIFLAGLGGVWLSTFQGLHSYGTFATLVTLNPAVRLGSALVLLWMGMGVEGALIGYLLGHATTVLLGAVLGLGQIRRDLTPEEAEVEGAEGPPSYRGLVKYGSVVLMGTVAAQVFEWTDKVMLTAWRPIEEVAFYTIAFGMVTLPLLIPRSINITFFPTVASLHGAGDEAGLRRATERVMRLTMVLMAFIPVAMMAIAPWVVGLLYGEVFLPAVVPFLVLAVWGLVRPIGLLAYSIPKGVGQPMVGARAMVATAVLNVALNAVLIPPLGTLGAAVATTASYVVGFSYLTYASLRLVGASFPWVPVAKTVASAVAAAAVMLAAFLLAPEIDPAGPSWALIPPVAAVGCLGLVVYVALLGLTRSVTREDADFVRSLDVPASPWLATRVEFVANMRGGGVGSTGPDQGPGEGG